MEVESHAADISTIPDGLPFPLVALGASAGGLAAFEAFFSNMPSADKSGIAFVLVQHLDPDHKSLLTELLRRYTNMNVYEVETGMRVEPNCTYIIPPNKDMALLHGQFQLMEPAAPRGQRLPIDFFFRSLAQEEDGQAICIVLSGTGTDGTLGARAIKESGGMVMVQDPVTAGYDGMPRSAIATGLADYVLAPEKMPGELLAYANRTFAHRHAATMAITPDITNSLSKIFVLLRSRVGHDFSHYKLTTIRRRVEKRMAVNQIEHLEDYVRYLRENALEIDILFKELLIGVTGFFRDPEAYETLKQEVIPHLFAHDAVRVWITGCSTGEEAYSIAILLYEYAESIRRDFNAQIFATDIDHDSIEIARAGAYPANVAADISPERLSRFFVHEENGLYRIKKIIRDALVFAEQDVIKDPPFSKLHLISCRNLLIYMESKLQKKLVPLFHYALAPGGYLFLGTSETVGDFFNLFHPVDKKWKLYQRKEGPTLMPGGVGLPVPPLVMDAPARPAIAGDELKDKAPRIREVAERAILDAYAPASALVNDRGDILFVQGRTGNYLELASGDISMNILRTAREGLRMQVAAGLRKVFLTKQPVRYERLTVKTNGDAHSVHLMIRPVQLPHYDQPIALIAFEDAGTPGGDATDIRKHATPPRDEHIASLERDLKSKEEYLQTMIEELETANEELRSTNEELQSTNEELQSTNEELETSKEELQSVNEELTTVNAELQQKIDELSRVNNDMNNLLAGTGIGTVFVDRQLNIQRFTPSATKIINLIQADVGRPVGHIVSNLTTDGSLVKSIQEVLDTLEPREKEVQTRDGRRYIMRILPYRTVQNEIEGAVLTFVDITDQSGTATGPGDT